ncbi:hypothetical protein ACTXT7_008869 [Hymenolepis weldensis]
MHFYRYIGIPGGMFSDDFVTILFSHSSCSSHPPDKKFYQLAQKLSLLFCNFAVRFLRGICCPPAPKHSSVVCCAGPTSSAELRSGQPSICYHPPLSGVIRTREFLTATSPRSYMFPVQYNDCENTGVNKATAIVNIRVVESNCQPKWNDLPSTLFYSSNEQQPKRLLWPQNYRLDMCGMTCDSSESRIYTDVILRHANPSESLSTASPSLCRHDQKSLHEQRKLCDPNYNDLVPILPLSTLTENWNTGLVGHKSLRRKIELSLTGLKSVFRNDPVDILDNESV